MGAYIQDMGNTLTTATTEAEKALEQAWQSFRAAMQADAAVAGDLLAAVNAGARRVELERGLVRRPA